MSELLLESTAGAARAVRTPQLRRLRLVHAYPFDAANVNVQSGRPYFLHRHLLAGGCEVLRAFPLDWQEDRRLRWKRRFHAARGLAYPGDREPRALARLARQVERRLREVSADVVFSPGSLVLTELDVPLPKVLVADATFANVVDAYPAFRNCAPAYVAAGHAQERRALANCDAAIYPSEWAARTACEVYGASPDKVWVVPFGANGPIHDPAVVESWIRDRPRHELRLLFVGRDWERKGGDLVVDTCRELVRRGLRVRLDVVGVERSDLPGFARVHGFLDKRDPAHRARLHELLARAHFLFVPSRAENYGLVFCEAAAHGLPAVATTAGGIPTIVRHELSGFTLAPDSPVERWADTLESAHGDERRYRDLARASHAEARTRLNWRVFVDRFLEIARRLA